MIALSYQKHLQDIEGQQKSGILKELQMGLLHQLLQSKEQRSFQQQQLHQVQLSQWDPKTPKVPVNEDMIDMTNIIKISIFYTNKPVGLMEACKDYYQDSDKRLKLPYQ